MKLVAIVALSLLMVNVGAAHAERPLAEYVAFAQAVWHAPCANIAADYTDAPAPGELGIAWPQQCQIGVTRGMSDAMTCAVVMHEVGHLVVGLQHSTDQHDIMYPATMSLPICQRRYGTIRDLRAVALEQIDEPGWTCQPARRDQYAIVFSCRFPQAWERSRVTVNYWLDTTIRPVRWNAKAPRG